MAGFYIKFIKQNNLQYYLILKQTKYKITALMHSSFKSKPIPFSKIQHFQQINHDQDDVIIPDQHTVKINKINADLSRNKNNMMPVQKILDTSHKTNKNITHKQNNYFTKNNINQCQSSKKLTHGLTSYKDIKQSYNPNHSNSKDKSKQGSRLDSTNKKQFKLDEEYLNKVDRDSVQCTFTPKTNNNGQSRSFKDFVDSQQIFLTKRQEKIKKIQKQKLEKQSLEFTAMPKIDQKSRKISETAEDYHMDSHGSLKKIQKKTPIYERLYNIPRKKDRVYQQQASFTPKILNKSKTMIRGDKVQNLLYEDAQRRIDHQKLIDSQAYQKQAMASKYPPLGSSAKQVKNNKKLLCKKIRSQFLQLLQEQSDQGVIQKSVSAIMVITIISQLFNVQLNPNINEQLCSRVISYLISQQLSQKSRQNSTSDFAYVQTKKLWQFIKAVVIGVDAYERGVTMFKQQQMEKIHKQFGYFYGLRLAKFPSKFQQQVDEELQYKIQTSKNTNKLAEIYRTKKFQQINQFISESKIPQSINSMLSSLNLTNKNIGDQSKIQQKAIKLQDLLILDSIRKKAQLQQKRLKNEENQLKNCTFRPSLNEKSVKKAIQRKARSKQHLKTVSQCQRKQIIKQVEQKQNKQKSKKILIKSKNNEMRVSLTDNKQNNMKQNINNQTCKNIKNVDKTLLRLNLARKMRNVQTSQRQRGYHCKNSQNWLKQMQQQKKQILGQVSNFFGYKSDSLQKQKMSTIPNQNYQSYQYK